MSTCSSQRATLLQQQQQHHHHHRRSPAMLLLLAAAAAVAFQGACAARPGAATARVVDAATGADLSLAAGPHGLQPRSRTGRSLKIGPNYPGVCQNLWNECWLPNWMKECKTNPWLIGQCDKACGLCELGDEATASGNVVISPQARKPAYQSSKIVFSGPPTGVQYGPELAVDFDFRTEEGACALTKSGDETSILGFTNQWWYVDLLSTYTITKIEVYIPDDNATLLDGGEVRAGNDIPGSRTYDVPNGRKYEGTGLVTNALCGTIDSSAAVEGSVLLTCPSPVSARYVSIATFGGLALKICEVVVYAAAEAETQVPLVGLTATSSEFYSDTIQLHPWEDPIGIDYGPEYSIDNMYTKWWGSSALCTIINPQYNMEEIWEQPYWAVDLGQRWLVTKVLVYRTDDDVAFGGSSIDYAEVHVGDILPGRGFAPDGLDANAQCGGPLISAQTENGAITVHCAQVGQYVSIVQPHTGKGFTLCEVLVYGMPPPDAPVPITQVATGKVASQSANAVQAAPYASAVFPAALGVDDRLDSCAQVASSASGPSWWTVDLSKTHFVLSITVNTYAVCQDCSGPVIGGCPLCQANVDEAEVRVGTKSVTSGGLTSNYVLCGKLNYAQAAFGGAITVVCPANTKGRYVSVVSTAGSELTICEVLVNGSLPPASPPPKPPKPSPRPPKPSPSPPKPPKPSPSAKFSGRRLSAL